MKRLKLYILILLATAQTLFAQNAVLNFENPETLLERAKVGRHEYMDIIYQVRNHFFQPGPESELLTYLNLIPEFEKIEKMHNFPIFEVKPVEMMAERLTLVASTVIDIFRHPPATVELFYFWAKDEMRYQLLEMQAERLKKVPYTIDELEEGLFNARVLLYSKPSGNAPFPTFLVEKIKELEGNVIKRMIKISETSSPVIYKAIKVIQSHNAINITCAQLIEDFSRGKDGMVSEEAARLVITLGERARTLDPLNDSGTHFGVSTLASKMLMSYIEYPEALNGFDELVQLVRVEDYNDMINFFQIYSFVGLHKSKAEIVVALLKRVRVGLERINSSKYALITHQLYSLLVKDVVNQYEGQFRVQMGPVKAILTLYRYNFFRMGYVLTTENGQYLSAGVHSKLLEDGRVMFSNEDFYQSGVYRPGKFMIVELTGNKMTGQMGSQYSISVLEGDRIQSFTAPQELEEIGKYEGTLYGKDQKGNQYSFTVFANQGKALMVEMKVSVVGLSYKVAKLLPFSFIEEKAIHAFHEVSEGNQRNLTYVSFFKTPQGMVARVVQSHLTTPVIIPLSETASYE